MPYIIVQHMLTVRLFSITLSVTTMDYFLYLSHSLCDRYITQLGGNLLLMSYNTGRSSFITDKLIALSSVRLPLPIFLCLHLFCYNV